MPTSQCTEITAPAGTALPAIAARPTDRHPITLGPVLHAVADGVDVPGDLMARGYREMQTWPLAVDEDRI
jgi:hypothetical protein